VLRDHAGEEVTSREIICLTLSSSGRRPLACPLQAMVFINHPTWTTPDLPFGGIINSGYGRELSSMGIQEFVNKKLVRVAAINAAA